MLYRVLALFVYHGRVFPDINTVMDLLLHWLNHLGRGIVVLGGIPLLTNGLGWRGLGYAKLCEGVTLL